MFSNKGNLLKLSHQVYCFATVDKKQKFLLFFFKWFFSVIDNVHVNNIHDVNNVHNVNNVHIVNNVYVVNNVYIVNNVHNVNNVHVVNKV